MNESEFYARFDAIVAQYLPVHDDQHGAAPLRAAIAAYRTRPAHLTRPRLLVKTAALYNATGGTIDGILDLAVATELLHLFALMHDDAIDGNGRDGVTERSPVLAILGGDLLQMIAFDLIERTVTDYGYDAVIPHFLRTIAIETILGQAEETSNDPPKDEDALLALYDRKTSRYSYVAPMVTAVHALPNDATGTRAREDIPTLERIGCLAGRRLQLRDDVHDLANASPEQPLPPWEHHIVRVWERTGSDRSFTAWSDELAHRLEETIAAELAHLSLPSAAKRELYRILAPSGERCRTPSVIATLGK